MKDNDFSSMGKKLANRRWAGKTLEERRQDTAEARRVRAEKWANYSQAEKEAILVKLRGKRPRKKSEKTATKH